MRHLIGMKTERNRQQASRISDRLQLVMHKRLENSSHRLKMAAVRLDGMSPLKRMSGGYGYLADESGRNIRSVKEIRPGEKMTTYIQDGRILSEVISAEEVKQWKLE